MNERVTRLDVLSILDAKVITGPARGLIHLARYLPRDVRLHVAVLQRPTCDSVSPLADAARGTPLTVHPLVEHSSYDPTVILRACTLARRIGARIVQSHSYKPHLIAMGVRARCGIPWIALHHGWTAENLKVRLFHALDRFSLRHADRVVTVSTCWEARLRALGCQYTVTIPNAVDPVDIAPDSSREQARATLKLPTASVIASAIGRLSHEKGQDVLLHAFALVAAGHPELRITLAGDGPDRTLLAALARSLGIEHRVHFLGHRSSVGTVYAASDVVVLPSRSEGMPNVLLEAMSLGVPVIATRVGGVGEVAIDGQTAWLVPPEDPAALASAIDQALRDPEERAVRADRARAWVENFHSPARRAERFMALYASVLGQLQATQSVTSPKFEEKFEQDTMPWSPDQTVPRSALR